MSLIDSIAFCGATLYADKSCHFKVWAPLKDAMMLHVERTGQQVDMEKDEWGYFHATLPDVDEETRYFFLPDGERKVPDPASNFQRDGVHGPSAVVSHARFAWTDTSWRGVALKDLVIYEIHVGTITSEGTFEAIIPLLGDLSALGITAIELMPIAQFPGSRNWGYDGVFPYAVQNSYGGPDGLKKLVDACHNMGIAVILDVVYNHLGPEGNCLKDYGPYFTARYATPWGEAINFDDAWSDGVREYFCYNALYWFHYYHIDGLRLDAIHMMFDNGAVHFLQYLNETVRSFQEEAGRPLYLIAESDLNSPRVINDPVVGGHGFAAQWLDDFHHALYVVLDRKGKARYEDFGSIEQLAKALKEGFVHAGDFVTFRKRRHGSSSAGIAGNRFVAFTSNHDQVGNRPRGERLAALIDFPRLKLAAAALLLSPYIPMLFMGDEYGEESPFYYFISHSDPELIEAVRIGRRNEFKEYHTEGESPDPQDQETFSLSRLHWERRQEGYHAVLLSWNRELIRLRQSVSALRNFDKNDIHIHPAGKLGLLISRHEPGGRARIWYGFNFGEEELTVALPEAAGIWTNILNSDAAQWSMKGEDSAVLSSTAVGGAPLVLKPLSVRMYKEVHI